METSGHHELNFISERGTLYKAQLLSRPTYQYLAVSMICKRPMDEFNDNRPHRRAELGYRRLSSLFISRAAKG